MTRSWVGVCRLLPNKIKIPTRPRTSTYPSGLSEEIDDDADLPGCQYPLPLAPTTRFECR